MLKFFKRRKKQVSPEILELKYSPAKTKQYSKRQLIKIGKSLYLRKDLVEQKIADVINVKIEKGELIKSEAKSSEQ